MAQNEVWIAINPDTLQGPLPAPNTDVYGSGTQADPYDGSTSERFDNVMRFLADNEGAYLIHLGPGTFPTLGLCHTTTGQSDDPNTAIYGWHVGTGWRISGSGEFHTQRVPVCFYGWRPKC